MNILHIDSSARRQNSVTRKITQDIVDHLNASVIRRDLNDTIAPVTEDWMNANLTSSDQRTASQKDQLSLSDALIEELQNADVIVIGAPIYNFSIPASLKLWFDMVARAGITFKYTEKGPQGLLEGKRAVVVIASGGTRVGSEQDFATGYVRQFLGFIGIQDVDFVSADGLMVDADEAINRANTALAELFPNYANA